MLHLISNGQIIPTIKQTKQEEPQLFLDPRHRMSNTIFTWALLFQSCFMVRKFGLQIRRCLEKGRTIKNFISIGFLDEDWPILNYLTNTKLPLAFHIQLSLIWMFVDIFSNNYIFNPCEYVQIKLSTKGDMRRNGFNPMKLLRGSTADRSFFSRSANIYKYLHRHPIIELNDTSIMSKCKKSLLTKPFDIHIICTYFICCSLSKGICTLNIIWLSFL